MTSHTLKVLRAFTHSILLTMIHRRSISHHNDMSCGCKVNIGNVFSNGPSATFTLCSPDIIYVINPSKPPLFFTTLPLPFIIFSGELRTGGTRVSSSSYICEVFGVIYISVQKLLQEWKLFWYITTPFSIM